MAAVMAETFDTQMLDYPTDTDFPMHGHVSDATWAAENDTEVSMDADGLFVLNETELKSGDVEVDMDDTYGHHSEEYIMTDAEELDNGNVLAEDHQITEDIEVLDETAAHDEHSMPLEEPVLNSVAVEVADSPVTVPMAYEATEPLVTPGVSEELVATDAPVEEISYAAHGISEETNESTELSVPAPVDDSDAAEVVAQIDATFVPAAEDGGDDDALEHQQEVVDPELTAEDAESRVEPSATEHNAEPEASYEGAEQSVSDPHELADGIYIDPPPAVLVSLPSQEATICLFNSLSSSGSSTPVASTSKAVEEDYLVLLQEQPTLYYDPLSSIFDALRQEESILNTFDLENSELVLDAYDLQLLVSEDNIYSHEVSLHDLNVLHDASGLSGPLRLRLQSTSPRFIVRFQTLKDQLARTGLEDGHEHGEIYQEETSEYTSQGENIDDEQHYQEEDDERDANTNEAESAQDAQTTQTTEEHYEDHPQEESNESFDHQDGPGDVLESDQRESEAGHTLENSANQEENMYLQEGDEESNLPKEDSAVLDPAATETTLLAHESSENTEEGTQPAETTGNDQPDEEEDVNAADLEDPEQNDTGPIDNIITDDQQQQPLEEITEDSADVDDTTDPNLTNIDDEEVATELLSENTESADLTEPTPEVVQDASHDEALPGDWDEYLEEAETTILDDETTATGSSVTLSTKRSFDDFDEDNNEELAEEESASRPTSPDSKRLRVE